MLVFKEKAGMKRVKLEEPGTVKPVNKLLDPFLNVPIASTFPFGVQSFSLAEKQLGEVAVKKELLNLEIADEPVMKSVKMETPEAVESFGTAGEQLSEVSVKKELLELEMADEPVMISVKMEKPETVESFGTAEEQPSEVSVKKELLELEFVKEHAYKLVKLEEPELIELANETLNDSEMFEDELSVVYEQVSVKPAMKKMKLEIPDSVGPSNKILNKSETKMIEDKLQAEKAAAYLVLQQFKDKNSMDLPVVPAPRRAQGELLINKRKRNKQLKKKSAKVQLGKEIKDFETRWKNFEQQFLDIQKSKLGMLKQFLTPDNFPKTKQERRKLLQLIT